MFARGSRDSHACMVGPSIQTEVQKGLDNNRPAGPVMWSSAPEGLTFFITLYLTVMKTYFPFKCIFSLIVSMHLCHNNSPPNFTCPQGTACEIQFLLFEHVSFIYHSVHICSHCPVQHILIFFLMQNCVNWIHCNVCLCYVVTVNDNWFQINFCS